MDDFIVLAHSSKLVDVPPPKGTTGKGACWIIHRSYLFHFVANNVISFTTVGQVLTIKIPSQNIHISVVEADRVRTTTKAKFIHESHSTSIEFIAEDVGRFTT